MTGNTQGQADGGQGRGWRGFKPFVLSDSDIEHWEVWCKNKSDNEPVIDGYMGRLFIRTIRDLQAQLEQAQARLKELEGMVAHMEASSAWQIGSAVIQGKYKEWEAAHIEQATPARASEGVDN